MAAAQARAVAEFDAAQRIEHVQRGVAQTAGRSSALEGRSRAAHVPSWGCLRSDGRGAHRPDAHDACAQEGAVGKYAASVMVSATVDCPVSCVRIDERLAGRTPTDGLVRPGQIALGP